MGDGTMDALPNAIGKRQRVVRLADGQATLVVERWSLSKMLYVFEYVANIFNDLPNEELIKLKGQPYELALVAVRLLGDKVTGFLKLSVPKAEEHKITEDMPAEEALDVIAAVVDLNITEDFLKKVGMLKSKLGPLFGSKSASTQSK